MKHEDYQDMLTPHALGALDRADRGLIEKHLDTCADCRAELDQWRDTAGVLAHAAGAVEPSPQVRERILADVRAERSALPDNVVDLRLRPRRLGSPLPRFLAIAASVILVALIGLVAILWQQNRKAKADLARLTAEADQAGKDREQDRKLLELLSSSTGRVVQLTGTAGSAASAYLVYDATSGRAILRTHGLPQTTAGRAYQLWFIAGGAPVPGHVFKVGVTGEGTLSDQIPTQTLPPAVFAVTEENESGATAPTGPILLRSTS